MVSIKQMNFTRDGELPSIIDVCCGSKKFWYDKEDSRALFMDIRKESHILPDKSYSSGQRTITINPDLVADFTNMPFEDNSFKLVVFDPPHLVKVGRNSYIAKSYGQLPENWRDVLRKGFKECFRILETEGILIFKWNEVQIQLNQILKLTENKPLFGHRTGKHSKTHWVTFMKGVK